MGATFTSHSFVSETEWRTKYGKYKSQFRSGVELCAYWWQWVFDSDYEVDILKKNKNKTHRNQSILDEEDDIPLNTLMQEPINQSDVITEISQDPRANNEQEIVPI